MQAMPDPERSFVSYVESRGTANPLSYVGVRPCSSLRTLADRKPCLGLHVRIQTDVLSSIWDYELSVTLRIPQISLKYSPSLPILLSALNARS